jgi:hypothetical protein
VTEFRGHVVKRPFGVGSKSERTAVVLETGAAQYLLRRRGGNAFADPELDALIGRHLSVEGTLSGNVLLIDSWKEA